METKIYQVYSNGLLETESPVYQEVKDFYNLLKVTGYAAKITYRYKDESEY